MTQVKEIANKEWGARKTKNTKLIHAYEQLDVIEQAKGDEKVSLLRKYGAVQPLNMLLSLNFNSKVTLDLPEGMPPIEPEEMDNVTHPDLMGILGANIHRLKNCTPASTLKAFKKEEIFLQVIAACPLKDVEILCAAKDKGLEELYPTITADLVKSVFPKYVG